MAKRRPQPLFSASPPQPHEDVPDESQHPHSFTSRLRRFLLTDGEALFRAEQRQADYHAKLDQTHPQPRN